LAVLQVFSLVGKSTKRFLDKGLLGSRHVIALLKQRIQN